MNYSIIYPSINQFIGEFYLLLCFIKIKLIVLNFICFSDYTTLFYCFASMNNIWLFLYILQTISPQIVFFDDFETYDLQGATLKSFNYQGTWYQKTLQSATVYQIQNTQNTNCLDTVDSSVPSEMCINILDLNIYAVYEISFDAIKIDFIQLFSPVFKLYWNDNLLDEFIMDAPDVSQNFIFIGETNGESLATLCFFVNGSSEFMSKGAFVDNVTISFLRQKEIQNNSNVSLQVQANNSTNNQSANNSMISNSSYQLIVNNQTNSTNKQMHQEQVLEETQPTHPDEPLDTFTDNKYVHIGNIIISAIKWVQFVGFGYMISNLINFWNLIILNYFLRLVQQPYENRKVLEIFCIKSIKQSSLISFISKVFDHKINLKIPQYSEQNIPKGTNQWQWYQQAQISSNFLLNTHQVFISLGYCLVKIGLLCLLKMIPISFVQILVMKLKGKTLFLLFLYEIINNTHILIFPFAIIWIDSSNALSYSHNFIDLINNLAIILVPFGCLFTILLFLYVEILMVKSNKNPPKQKKQQEVIIRQPNHIIMQRKSLYHQQTQISIQSIHLIKSKLNKIASKQNHNHGQEIELLSQKKVAKTDKTSLLQKKITLFNLTDNLLFLLIPIFLQVKREIFFAFIFSYLSVEVFMVIRFRKAITTIEKIFRLGIKFLWIITNLIYLMFFLIEKHGLEFEDNQLVFLGEASVIMIIIGALIQMIHTIINIGISIVKVWRTISQSPSKNRIKDINKPGNQQLQDIIVSDPGNNRKNTKVEKLKKDQELWDNI